MDFFSFRTEHWCQCVPKWPKKDPGKNTQNCQIRHYVDKYYLSVISNVWKEIRINGIPTDLFLYHWWRHNGCNGVSNHQPHDCLLNRLFRRGSKKTSKLRVIGLCEGNSPVTGDFPAQRASNAENVSIWWRQHDNNSNGIENAWVYHTNIRNADIKQRKSNKNRAIYAYKYQESFWVWGQSIKDDVKM